MTLSSCRGVRCDGLIDPVVAQHCPQHVEASPGQRDDGLGMSFSFGAFAVVVATRSWAAVELCIAPGHSATVRPGAAARLDDPPNRLTG